jgi:hypothetical protein
MAYDIFISYRRKGAGAGVAGELQAKFENLGYKVFLDVDEIGSGQFPNQIKQAIEECEDFLLVLAPGTLDRCAEEEDWVRREIVLAQDFNKNIIGVGLPGFVMPDAEALPIPLRTLPMRQVFLWTHEYRAASFAKIEENLVSTKLRKKRKRIIRLALIPIILGLIIAGIVLLTKKSSSDNVEIQKVQETASSDAQMFEYHAQKALLLTQSLPDTNEFRKNFLQMVSDKVPFMKLMESIAECDSALMLKEQCGGRINDTYEIESKRKALLGLRRGYYNAIMEDIEVLLDEDGAVFARQDLEIAKLLEFPEEKQRLDSIEAIIENSIRE